MRHFSPIRSNFFKKSYSRPSGDWLLGISAMTVIRSAKPLVWGEMDLPLFGIGKDWYGSGITPQAAFCVAVDSRSLWFIASHGKAGKLHPAARPGRFTPELWKHDVAELFLSDPTSGRYFEFNLAP